MIKFIYPMKALPTNIYVKIVPLFISLFLLWNTAVKAQYTWQKSYGSANNYDYPAGLIEIGATYNVAGQWGTGSNDIFFMTTDNQGNMTVMRKYETLTNLNDFTYGFRKSSTGCTLFGNMWVGADRTPYILSVTNT